MKGQKFTPRDVIEGGAGFKLKAVGHDCQEGKHVAIMVNEKGEMVSTIQASAVEIQDFVRSTSLIKGVPIFYDSSCRDDPDMKDLLSHSDLKAHKSKDFINLLEEKK